MKLGFNDLPFKVSTSDGRNFVLLEPVTFLGAMRTFIIPAGATSDGASTPPEVWPVMPPFGKYWPAAFLHDSAYRGSLLSEDGTPAMLLRPECDGLIMEAMTSIGVPTIERDVIYEALMEFGQAAFDADRTALAQIVRTSPQTLATATQDAAGGQI